MRRYLRSGVIVLAVLYSVLHFVESGIKQPLANFQGDFLAAFPSWRVSTLLGRQDLYRGSLAERWSSVDVQPRARSERAIRLATSRDPLFGASLAASTPVWHYGPVLHLVTLPLFSCDTLRGAYKAWLFVNYLFVVLTLAVAIGIADRWRPTRATALIAGVAICNFNPFYEALTQRTIELLELLLIFGGYALLQRRRAISSGVAIGTAAMAKFLPLIFLPYWVLKREWRAVIAALAVIVTVVFVAQPVLGWQNSGIVHQLVRGGFIDNELDQSLAGAVGRIIEWTHSPLSVPVTSRITIVIAAIALTALMLRIRRRDGAVDLEWSLLIVAMVLLPPHNEQYYFVLLLFPYLMLFLRYRGQLSGRAAMLALSFFLVAMPVPFSLLNRVIPNAFRLYLRVGMPFAGAMMLAFVLVWELLRPSPGALEHPGSHESKAALVV